MGYCNVILVPPMYYKSNEHHSLVRNRFYFHALWASDEQVHSRKHLTRRVTTFPLIKLMTSSLVKTCRKKYTDVSLMYSFLDIISGVYLLQLHIKVYLLNINTLVDWFQHMKFRGQHQVLPLKSLLLSLSFEE